MHGGRNGDCYVMDDDHVVIRRCLLGNIVHIQYSNVLQFHLRVVVRVKAGG